MAARVQRALYLAFYLFLLCCALYAAPLDVVYGVQRSAIPYQLDYEEGNILNAGLRIIQGLTPYPDPHVFPNALNPYGPLPYLAVALVVKLAGVSFLWPRLLVVTSVFAIAFLIAFLVHDEAREMAAPSDTPGAPGNDASWWTWLVAAAFAALFPSMPLVQDWMPLLRVDLPGLALALAGLLALKRMPQRPWHAALLMTLAVFVKYTLIAAPLAALLWLLARRDRRALLTFAATGAGVGVVLLGLTQLWSGGHFAFHMLGTHADPFSFAVYRQKLSDFAVAHFWFMLLAAIYVFTALLRRSLPLPALYWLLCLGTVMTAGKRGSGGNHFLELVAATLICAALGVVALRTRVRWAAVAIPATLAAVALVGPFVLSAGPYNDPANHVRGCGDLYTVVKDYPGRNILSENVGAVLLAGKPVFISNPFIYRYLVTYRGWSDAAILERVRQRQFDLLVLSGDLRDARMRGSDRWSPQVIEAMAANYRPVAKFNCLEGRVVMAPIGPPEGASDSNKQLR